VSKRMVQAMWDRLMEAPGEMWSQAQHMGAHGAHELAAALFNHGSAFVMYQRAPRDGQQVEDPQAGLPQEAQQQQERGGMEM
jgi:hypothetical protein